MDLELDIRPDFSVRRVSRQTIVAIDKPVSIICLVRSSPDSPLERFDSMELSVCDETGSDLPWIPTQDAPNRKRFAVILPRPLLPDEPPVVVVTSGVWPKSASKLASVNGFSNHSIGPPAIVDRPVRKATVTIRFPSIAARFRVECPALKVSNHMPDSRGSMEFYRDMGSLAPRSSVEVTLHRVS